MKRCICALLVLSVICCVSGCRNGESETAHVALDEEQIESALQQLGLSGSISESETFFTAGGSVCYSIRDPEDNDRLTIAINSSDIEGKRFLKLMYFFPAVEKKPEFAWQDWKKQFELAALLSGGALEADALYLTFSQMEPTIVMQDYDGELPPEESFKLDAQLSPQYSIVQYRLHNSRVVHGFPSARVLAYSQRLVIYIFASETDYNNIQKDMAKAREAQNDKTKQTKRSASFPGKER